MSKLNEGRAAMTAALAGVRANMQAAAGRDEILERVRADLNALIDVNNVIENTTPHASPEMRGAQRRGTALRNALMALKEAD